MVHNGTQAWHKLDISLTLSQTVSLTRVVIQPDNHSEQENEPDTIQTFAWQHKNN